MPSVLPTPSDATEAALLVRRLQHAIDELQLREAELMTYELIRFPWRRDARRLEPGHRILDALATHNLGTALELCEELVSAYRREPLVHAASG